MAENKDKSKFRQIAPFIVQHPHKDRLADIRHDVIGIFFLCLSIFLFICNMNPDATGVVGRTLILHFLVPLLGKGILLLPVYTSLLGLFIIFGYVYVHFSMRLLGVLLGFFSFITLLELYFSGRILHYRWPMDYHGGGIVGYSLSYALQWLFGLKGAFILITTAVLASLLMVFNVKIKEIIQFLVRLIQKTSALIVALVRAKRHQPTAKIDSKPQLVSVKKFAVDAFVKSEDRNPPEAPIVKAVDQEQQLEEIRKKLFGSDEKKNTEKKVEAQVFVKQDDILSNASYIIPSVDLLNDYKTAGFKKKSIQEEIIKTTQRLEDTLASFKIEAKVVSISQGPAVTRYELQPAAGIKVSKIVNLADDLALSLASSGIRIEAPIPGKSVIGIEVPNKTVETVNLLSLARTEKFEDRSEKLLVAVGLDIEGVPLFMNLAAMPHLLVAGATGSGKSVCINTLIISILLRATPMEVRFLMIDPKQVELSSYNGIPHLLAPVVTEPSKAAATLKWAVLEMNNRYEEFAKFGARNIESFNLKVDEMVKTNTEEVDKIFIPQRKPYIVVIIDELADLMMVASGEVETMIARLAQMARATGIHLVVATQRPSVDVITGLIKANIPSRISFAVSSQIDSRTILDSMGAEKLLGRGDMLYKPVGAMKPKRIQGVYISDQEINKVIKAVKQNGEPQYLDSVVNIKAEDFQLDGDSEEELEKDDPLFTEAKQIIQSTGQASTSFLQRKLKIGYNRAARIMDEMEKKGIISAYEGDSKTRSVLKFD